MAWLDMFLLLFACSRFLIANFPEENNSEKAAYFSDVSECIYLNIFYDMN